MALEELVTRVIVDYAGTAARVENLEESVKELKLITSEALKGINESLKSNAAILEKLNANMEEHRNIHRRIDESEAWITDLREVTKEMYDRVVEVEKGCAKTQHQQLTERVEDMETTIHNYEKDYSIIHSTAGKWIMGTFAGAVVLGFVLDMMYHYEAIKKLFFK